MSSKKMSKERLKYKYVLKERHSGRKSEPTIRRLEQSIQKLDSFLQEKPYDSMNEEDAVLFKKTLAKPSDDPDKDLVMSSGAVTSLRLIQGFLHWVKDQDGYKKLKSGVIDYLEPSKRESRASRGLPHGHIPTYDEVRAAIATIPFNTPTNRRDRAIIAFLSLVPVRDGAVLGLKLKHVLLDEKMVIFPANEVHTKRGKSLQCVFLPVGLDIEEVFVSWIKERLESTTDLEAPVFPNTEVGHDDNGSFSAKGLGEKHWLAADSIRKIVKKAFERIGIPDVIPHQFRNMILDYMRDQGLSMAELKALSLTFGHDSITTTMDTYGAMSKERQVSIMRSVYEKHYQNPKAEESNLRQKLENLLANTKQG